MGWSVVVGVVILEGDIVVVMVGCWLSWLVGIVVVVCRV
jgi:hypothetical protein